MKKTFKPSRNILIKNIKKKNYLIEIKKFNKRIWLHKKRHIMSQMQKFQNIQNFCSDKQKCIKCGLDHFTKDSIKSRQVAEPCANCNGILPTRR